MHFVGELPITDDDLVDEEGDTIEEPTPIVPDDSCQAIHLDDPLNSRNWDEPELGGES